MEHTLMPMDATPSDKAYFMHRTFLHLAFLYVDLRNAIRFEDGPHIDSGSCGCPGLLEQGGITMLWNVFI